MAVLFLLGALLTGGGLGFAGTRLFAASRPRWCSGATRNRCGNT